MCEQQGNCQLPKEKIPFINEICDATKSTKGTHSAVNEKPSNQPVGLLIDPELVGDTPQNEELRFYPCQVKENDFRGNMSKIKPDCNLETSYQTDFAYRGHDPRRCRTYEIRTNCEKYEMCYCVPPPPLAPPNYRKKPTDLKPTITQKKLTRTQSRDGINGVSDAFPPFNSKRRVTEYMDNISRLGGEMIACNLLGKSGRRQH